MYSSNLFLSLFFLFSVDACENFTKSYNHTAVQDFYNCATACSRFDAGNVSRLHWRPAVPRTYYDFKCLVRKARSLHSVGRYGMFLGMIGQPRTTNYFRYEFPSKSFAGYRTGGTWRSFADQRKPLESFSVDDHSGQANAVRVPITRESLNYPFDCAVLKSTGLYYGVPCGADYHQCLCEGSK